MFITSRMVSPFAAIRFSTPSTASRDERMLAAVDAIWDTCGHDRPGNSRRVSWVGFYIKSQGTDEMTLGPRRDKPACSPIGLHGACGRCFKSGRSLVVSDVASLGEGYIACDPRDKSEVVAPCLNPDGSAWGVLDLDSYEIGAFSAADAIALERLLVEAGLSAPATAAPAIV